MKVPIILNREAIGFVPYEVEKNKLVTDFKELRVYQAAYKNGLRIFMLSKAWPPTERYNLTDQIRRSSRSVCAHIAEAWFKRRYQPAFATKLQDRCSEAAETIVWINFATDCGYVTKEDGVELEAEYRSILASLVLMINAPERWCSLPKVRELTGESHSEMGWLEEGHSTPD